MPHIGYPVTNPGGGTVPRPNTLPGAPNCLYNPQQLAQDGRRALSYGLREVSRLLLGPYPEFAGALTCGMPMRHIPGDDVEVALYHDPDGYRVGFHGLMTCSSPWVCPVCSPKLAAQRGEALGRALAHFHAAGLWVAHAVLTVQHTRGEALADVFGALADAWRRMTKSREFRPYWSGLGYARGVEVTLGPNGWHPHIHLALVIPPDRDPYALEEALWEAWSGAVLEVGWAPSSRGAYSYQVVSTEADVREVGRYVSKAGSGWGVGAEVAGGARKESKRGGMSPFQLLGAAWAGYLEDPEGMASWFPGAEGDFSLGGLGGGGPLILRELCRAASSTAKRLGIGPHMAAWRWLEYAEATKGRKALTTSRALGLVLRVKIAEVEAEAQNAVPIEVIWLSRRVYAYLLRTTKLAYFVHLAEALGSLRRACEAMALVEGDEYTLPPAVGPPLSPEGGAERVLSSVRGAG